ncbi:glycine receptor subunit beta-like isoform X1 [Hydractinia symbiolongicarpus]|uniref:glycine receptor subunit beta-like isoform X1 n=2 Tax=Hydractinia symbiolongicarpus TaxID=13093 RepID=UPI002549FA6E|nr:glycine receptor subunit beta-like isoform X1 [Hydractinia symbiolongicarpus]
MVFPKHIYCSSTSDNGSLKLAKFGFFTCMFLTVFGYQSLAWIDELGEKVAYDKRLRPNHLGGPVNITEQIYIISLGPLDEQTFTYELDFYHRQWWHDPRLKRNNTHKDITYDRPPRHLFWIPHVAILNAKKTKKDVDSVRTVISATGDIYVSQRIQAICTCVMDLHYFPFDTQHCPFIMENFAFSNDDVRLTWEKNAGVHDNKLQLSGYSLTRIAQREFVNNYTLKGQNLYYDRLEVHFIVKRTFVYFVHRAYIPTIVLMVFNMGAYWVPPSAVPARMTLIVTTLLAIVVILQSVTEQTVKVPYTTPMQLFLIVNVLFIVIAVMETLLVLYLKNRKHEQEKAKLKTEREECNTEGCEDEKNETKSIPMDGYSMLFDSTVLVKWLERKREAKLEYHVVDRFCQYAVPGMYILFCCIYFINYISFGNGQDEYWN